METRGGGAPSRPAARPPTRPASRFVVSKIIDLASSVLMNRFSIDQAHALEMMQRVASRSGIDVIALARRVVDTAAIMAVVPDALDITDQQIAPTDSDISDLPPAKLWNS